MESPVITFIPNPMLAAIYGIFSVFSAALAAVPPNIDLWVRVAAGLAAIISAFFAARYYNIAYQEKKQSLKNLKSNNHEK